MGYPVCSFHLPVPKSTNFPAVAAAVLYPGGPLRAFVPVSFRLLLPGMVRHVLRHPEFTLSVRPLAFI